MSYPPVGSTIQVDLPIVDKATGEKVDPANLRAVVTAPDGSTQEYDYPDINHFTQLAVGEYLLLWEADTPGRWFWNLTTSGDGSGVGDGYVDVRDLYSGPGVQLDVLKNYIGITKTAEDDLLIRLLASVTLMIERYIGVSLTPNPAFDASGADTADPVVLTVPVAASAGALRFTGTLATSPTWASAPAGLAVKIPHAREITDIKLNQDTDSLPLVAIGDSGPGYWLTGDSRFPGTTRNIVLTGVTDAVTSLQVTGRFGLNPIPEDIVDAILTMTARRYKERDARWGDSVQLQDGAFVNYFRQYPLSVRATLDSYQELAA